ncbi:GNAT family N-acetyltransferase [Paracoccus sp. (in: a-proteobacteria)]|uniref:GNAT family N-acetyltransferase n=1 Tax=Paracoccus sp. TaxID=267 RepID=UPI00321F78DB
MRAGAAAGGGAIRTRILTGDAIAPLLDELARLRITVFRDWPYLYDGDLDYEREYLQCCLTPGSVMVGAWDGATLVGAATGAPMEDHAEEFAPAFAHRPEKLHQIFYCAESVVLPQYRGKGLARAFFDGREAHGRLLGRRFSAFCRVLRPENHLLRPPGFQPMDAFWQRRGYRPLPDVDAGFDWKDIGQNAPTRKRLQFWMRKL